MASSLPGSQLEHLAQADLVAGREQRGDLGLLLGRQQPWTNRLTSASG